MPPQMAASAMDAAGKTSSNSAGVTGIIIPIPIESIITVIMMTNKVQFGLPFEDFGAAAFFSKSLGILSYK